MLHDDKGGLAEFINESKGCIYIQKIVVGNLLAVQFVEKCFRITVKDSLLVGILSISERINGVYAFPESFNTCRPVKISEY